MTFMLGLLLLVGIGIASWHYRSRWMPWMKAEVSTITIREETKNQSFDWNTSYYENNGVAYSHFFPENEDHLEDSAGKCACKPKRIDGKANFQHNRFKVLSK